MMLFPLSVVLAAVIHVYAAQFSLYHRLVLSPSSSAPFVKRGTLNLAGANVNLESVSTLSEDLANLARSLNSEDLGGALYQVALQRPEDTSQAQWAVSSVKLVGSDPAIKHCTTVIEKERTVPPFLLNLTNSASISFRRRYTLCR